MTRAPTDQVTSLGAAEGTAAEFGFELEGLALAAKTLMGRA